ncbi:hypothetical protein LR48_Vigan07g235700 [Vigna angularis]|uniref:Uncharacterized protein n=1 Tax=Phaseolus angularis TaxID=3914 RepID=A0A0L9V0U0_PHAAN|nr:hypothetical protein LR48_Vigan07g235700 [Vigna angularis]
MASNMSSYASSCIRALISSPSSKPKSDLLQEELIRPLLEITDQPLRTRERSTVKSSERVEEEVELEEAPMIGADRHDNKHNRMGGDRTSTKPKGFNVRGSVGGVRVWKVLRRGEEGIGVCQGGDNRQREWVVVRFRENGEGAAINRGEGGYSSVVNRRSKPDEECVKRLD